MSRKIKDKKYNNSEKGQLTRKRYNDNRKLTRDKIREKLNQIKSAPCLDCGVQYPPYVMDFDHRDPTQKSFSVGMHVFNGWPRLLEEIAKCDLVCANCHRMRTHAASTDA